ncbi:DUF6934 family protein [Chitinophaga pinensis]|uniref:Uncharacterized protein n=1 Tax=Chitinophaga pinensis TaxID=79329 RepID=A0A5C6LY43_9BACT|nr:hypothetical protein [Chitinophaga pinensis]TWW02141.1 hypothetical protein FEF09_03075 [Chitinophaga pinensis]
MNHSQDVYSVRGESIPEEKALFYSFVSKGKKDITKIVFYNYVRQFNNRPLFNIGLVDIDIKTGKISDDAISDNEDQYRVFNTVLSTIPRLFGVYKDGVLIVQGSDSGPEFIENCKKVAQGIVILIGVVKHIEGSVFIEILSINTMKCSTSSFHFMVLTELKKIVRQNPIKKAGTIRESSLKKD